MPEDKVTLDAHYKDIHIPLTQAIPNLKSFEVNHDSALCRITRINFIQLRSLPIIPLRIWMVS
jgi:hypothetical protein